MQIATKCLLVLLYPLLVGAWLVNRLRGRDRLRLREPARGESCWIERRGRPDIASYFSESSRAEGGDAPSAARPLTRLLCRAARLYTPRRQSAGAYKAAAEREQGIPDEVYTLW
jgi:hypothetical protein